MNITKHLHIFPGSARGSAICIMQCFGAAQSGESSSGTALGSLSLPRRLQSPVRTAQPPASQHLILCYARASLLREIHRASECALQWPQRPIGSRGEANLVSPRDFQKVNPLIICVLAKPNPRGEFHEARKTAPAADAMSAGAFSEGCRRRMRQGKRLSAKVDSGGCYEGKGYQQGLVR